jgi:dTDP-4-amino-4,6-dideoxygalactose transaminase
MMQPVPLIDLAAQRERIRDRLDAAIGRVLDHGQYIRGPEVAVFEERIGAYCGARHAISCSNGTDALMMALMAHGIGRGDAVICPAFTFTATPEVIALLGATPVFCDVDARTFNLEAASLPAAVDTARSHGLRPRALIAVDLFGQPADYPAILSAADTHDLIVVCDAAQSFGAKTGGLSVGRIGHVTTTSFFPAKPLGCFGDGGAIFTDAAALADVLRSLRLHGKGADKYDIVRVGMNGRLDTLQAAILIEKLAIFADEVERRRAVARRYDAGLGNVVTTPHVPTGVEPVWAQYTVTVPGGRRDALAAALHDQGIQTAVYYPKPLHQQKAFRDCLVSKAGAAVSERLAGSVLSLPMHPYLHPEQQERVIAAVRDVLN